MFFVHILSFPVYVFVGKHKCSGGNPYENVQKTYGSVRLLKTKHMNKSI